MPLLFSGKTPSILGVLWPVSGIHKDKISLFVQSFFIKIEHGPVASLIPIAAQRFLDKIIFGLDRASLDNTSTVLSSMSSDARSKTDIPEFMSEITSFPPLLSSDIALSILSVKLLLFI